MGGAGSSSTASNSLTPTIVTGTVYSGATNNATVSLYAANAQGVQTGSALGTAQTNATGQYSISLSTPPAGPVVLVASGGSYSSEADQSTQNGPTYVVLIGSVANNPVVSLNPLTAAISAAASSILTAGGSNTTVANALSTATSTVEKAVGLSAISTNPMSLTPNLSATSGDALLLTALLGSLEQLRLSVAMQPADFYKALMSDISDGVLNGLQNDKPIQLGSSTLQPSTFTSQLSGAANAYSSVNPAVSSVVSSIAVATQQAAQAAGSVSVGSSGSVAPLLTQSTGAQIYFAARGAGLIKLDMSNPAKPVASKMTAINTSVMSASGANYSSVDGIVIDPTPITVGGTTKIYGILYSYRNSTVVSVNLTDGVVVSTLLLTIKNKASFSGADAYVAGGISDGAHNLIWLATGDGLMGINPSDLTQTPISIAQPTGTQINENVGGDPAAGIVFSPDYNGQAMVVFNLIDHKAYIMDNTAWTALANGKTSNPSILYGELDSAALDSQYHTAVIVPEATGLIGLMQYSTLSGATGATGTFSSPQFMTYQAPSGSYPSGAAVDPVSHTVLFVGEGNGIAAGVLDNPTNTSWKGFSSFVATGSNSSYQFQPHDPHTLGIFNIAGTPYGFLLQGYNDPYKVVSLNMNNLLNAANTGGVLNSDPLLDSTIATLTNY